MAVAHPDFVDWQEQSRSFEQIAAFALTGFNVTGEDGAERVTGATMSANFFDVLGVRPVMGRTFLFPSRVKEVRLDRTIVSWNFAGRLSQAC